VAIDGTTLDVADTPANLAAFLAAFGKPSTGRGERVGAFPQVRLVGVAECGTHAVVAAAFGPHTLGEVSLAPRVWCLARWGQGCWCWPTGPAGGGAVARWRQAHASGAALLWRAKTGTTGHALPVDQHLADGSWLSRLDAGGHPGGHRRPDPRGPAVVWVLQYTLDDPGRPGHGQRYRLVTSILDPAAAPAIELAVLNHQRWELETTLGELKTHQRGPRAVLRSKTPQGVEQEIWAHLLVHYAIRALMHQAALDADTDPDRFEGADGLEGTGAEVFDPSRGGAHAGHLLLGHEQLGAAEQEDNGQ